ncbi:FecR domain-containing protein [Methylobacterium durans]|uniref:Iron dicitrate transport regulator FecR n=1 Tax=Methylobacterium durans TaxID=2202825 RepID=A0A2U8W472_9HYPH|nr:FecR domain-containing protein [Methylobacterium durans]AWN40438.1 iron dicitrate transport regulator FecR [Methylobacterium durans]
MATCTPRIAGSFTRVAAFAVALIGGPVSAQTQGCILAQRSDPPGQVLTCRDGLVIRTEPGSALSLSDRNRDGIPEAARLDAKGTLIQAPPGRGGFQIRTPHAVAVVRGTVWAVDVTEEQTSVFVETGRVAVRRPGGRPVELGAGDGVDVKPGQNPLVVKRWSAARAAALLARFRP